MDGVKATRLITGAWPHIPVLGLTTYVDSVRHDAMRNAGAVQCLIKSGRSEDLIRAIHGAVHHRANAAKA
jgi:CheY-like chemotaxis protein